MTDLADRSFIYMITGTNLTAHYDDLDPFAYVATSWYTSDKFYEIIIDTGVLKRLIVGYG